MTPTLIPPEEAAKRLGVPAAALREVAEAHGYLIQVGRAVRVREDELGEIIEKCRVKPRERVSTSSDARAAPPSTSSGRQDEPTCPPARAISERLKRPSRPISSGTPAQPVPLRRER